uniref:Uncharacterized protein n=1 Tax=Fagus sylvatica TaxID=28930 RepID=A0A2N9GJ96_FAGSY
MAMVATTAAPPQAPPPTSLLNQDSLSHIDILTLSQSSSTLFPSVPPPPPPSTNPLGLVARSIFAPPIPTLPTASSLPTTPNASRIANGFLLRPNPNPSLHLHRRGKPLQNGGEETHEGQ